MAQPVSRDSDSRTGRLLFLAQMLPYPPDTGVSIRSFNVLRLLARQFEVTALCFYRRAHQPHPQDVAASLEALRKLAVVRAFPIPQEHSRLRFVSDHGRSVLTRSPYTVFAHRSRDFMAAVREALARTTFDVAHIDSLDLAEYASVVEALPRVCVHHNVESDLLERRASTAGFVERQYLKLQAAFTRVQEQHYCPTFDLNVAVSADDASRLTTIAPASRVAVVPNGVDTSQFSPADREATEGLVFVGGHSWAPNREAMAFFCSEILPLIRARGFNPKVTWVGTATPAAKDEYASRYGVHLTGYVDDIRPWVHGASCYIVPLRAGGGTRLKILDAWAMGKAVVSTSVGCEGLSATHRDNILIADTADAFAAAVIDVLTDGDLRRRLGMAARRTAVERYDWEVLGRQMLPLYTDLLRRRSGRRAQ